MKRLSEKRIHFLTAVSFLLLLMCWGLFVLIAPGHYNTDSLSTFDYVMAIVVLFNNACIIISFFYFLRSLSYVLVNCTLDKKAFFSILLSLYPITILLFVCSFHFETVFNYMLFPLNVFFLL